MCNNINKTEKTRQNQKPIEQVLNLDDDDLLRRPRVGHVAAQAVGVRRNRQSVANPGMAALRLRYILGLWESNNSNFGSTCVC